MNNKAINNDENDNKIEKRNYTTNPFLPLTSCNW